MLGISVTILPTSNALRCFSGHRFHVKTTHLAVLKIPTLICCRYFFVSQLFTRVLSGHIR